MTKRWRRGAKTLLLGASFLALPGVGGEGSRAQVPEEGGLVYESPGLRIVRGLDRQGRPVLLLTNLDDDGNRLMPAEANGPPACAPETPDGAAPTPPPAAPAGQPEGAPIIVINIENQVPAPAPQVAVAPAGVVPVVAFGGIPGRFRYPERLPFLGYGPGIASPSWLGGLGLNAGNRFGLGGSRGCGDGYDCLFAPSPARP